MKNQPGFDFSFSLKMFDEQNKTKRFQFILAPITQMVYICRIQLVNPSIGGHRTQEQNTKYREKNSEIK